MASIPNYPQLYDDVLPAGADLSARQFRFVKKDAGTYVLCDNVVDMPAGVLQNKPALGEPCEVIKFGPTKVSTAAATTAGWLIGTDANGQAARKIPGTNTTHYVAGQALSATAAINQVAAAFINCVTPHRAA
jgi:hypothetical protein